MKFKLFGIMITSFPPSKVFWRTLFDKRTRDCIK